jgi:hypothetical protein
VPDDELTEELGDQLQVAGDGALDEDGGFDIFVLGALLTEVLEPDALVNEMLEQAFGFGSFELFEIDRCRLDGCQ